MREMAGLPAGIDLSQLAGGGQGVPSLEQVQAEQAQKAEREAQREAILMSILEPAAAERITRMKLVRADKARAVEDSLIRAATTGALKQKVSEEHLVAMLGQYEESQSAGGGAKKGITIQRRKYGMDDDDDDDNDDDLR